MGQAKQRGTFEERKAQALVKKETLAVGSLVIPKQSDDKPKRRIGIVASSPLLVTAILASTMNRDK